MKTLILCLLALTCLPRPIAEAAKSKPPNLILILADDLGYADIGVQGARHLTPHLDRMAAQGVRLTSFVTAGNVCTPTRTSLMTGCYPKRVGLHQHVLFPGGKKGISASEVTLAELLKAKGYATMIIGKWHLGDQPEFLPTRHGFDDYFGIPFSNDMGQMTQQGPTRTDRPKTPLLRAERVAEEEPDQRTLTRRYTAEAVKFIETNRAKPFFLYLPHAMPHWPHYSSAGFDGKSGNGTFGDAVTELDWSVGELLGALKRLKLDEQTLVVFTSDNGGPVFQGATNTPLHGAKGGTFEGGHRAPFLARWPGRVPAGRVVDELAASFDLYTTLAKLGGAEVPKDRIVDGKDIWPLLTASPGAKSPHEAFFYYTAQGRLQGVRSGQWKLLLPNPDPVAAKAKGKANPNVASELTLFDLATDLRESKNLAAEQLEVVKRLEALLARARADLGDDVHPGPGCRPAGNVENAKPLTGM